MCVPKVGTLDTIDDNHGGHDFKLTNWGVFFFFSFTRLLQQDLGPTHCQVSKVSKKTEEVHKALSCSKTLH